jgi:hypothetical protein
MPYQSSSVGLAVTLHSLTIHACFYHCVFFFPFPFLLSNFSFLSSLSFSRGVDGVGLHFYFYSFLLGFFLRVGWEKFYFFFSFVKAGISWSCGCACFGADGCTAVVVVV